MNTRKILRSVHLAGTAWFVLSVGYMFILALLQAGFNWLLIFSLSGHSALFVFFLVSLYLFALYRGIGGAQQIEKEHPLTTNIQYMGFYVSAPFLGGLAGLLGMYNANTIKQYILIIAFGTLITTFSVWVIIDPVVGLMEMLLPESRKHRAQRVAEAEVERKKRQARRNYILDDVLTKEQAFIIQCRKDLQPEAEKLAALLDTNTKDFKQAEHEAVDIGAKAWQYGGLHCMKELRKMAISTYYQYHEDKIPVDYISIWWNGIGSWREQPST